MVLLRRYGFSKHLIKQFESTWSSSFAISSVVPIKNEPQILSLETQLRLGEASITFKYFISLPAKRDLAMIDTALVESPWVLSHSRPAKSVCCQSPAETRSSSATYAKELGRSHLSKRLRLCKALHTIQKPRASHCANY